MLTLIGRTSPTVSRATVARLAAFPRLRYQRCASARSGDNTTFSASRDDASPVQSRRGPTAVTPVGRANAARPARAACANAGSTSPCPITSIVTNAVDTSAVLWAITVYSALGVAAAQN